MTDALHRIPRGMRPLVAVLIALVLLSVCAVDAAPDAATVQARKAIQAAYDQMAAAAGRRDVDGWLALKTPDFVSVSLDGKEVGLASRRVMMKMAFSAVSEVKARTRILAFKLVKPAEARATVEERTEMRFLKQDKTPSVMVVDTTAESTWIKTTAGWREKRSKSLKESGTLDGKPMPTTP